MNDETNKILHEKFKNSRIKVSPIDVYCIYVSHKSLLFWLEEDSRLWIFFGPMITKYSQFSWRVKVVWCIQGVTEMGFILPGGELEGGQTCIYPSLKFGKQSSVFGFFPGLVSLIFSSLHYSEF